jgi:hypothetical protein
MVSITIAAGGIGCCLLESLEMREFGEMNQGLKARFPETEFPGRASIVLEWWLFPNPSVDHG